APLLPLRPEEAGGDPGGGEPRGDVASVVGCALSRADRVRAPAQRAASPPRPPLGSGCPTQRPARHTPERNGHSPDFADARRGTLRSARYRPALPGGQRGGFAARGVGLSWA